MTPRVPVYLLSTQRPYVLHLVPLQSHGYTDRKWGKNSGETYVRGVKVCVRGAYGVSHYIYQEGNAIYQEGNAMWLFMCLVFAFLAACKKPVKSVICPSIARKLVGVRMQRWGRLQRWGVRALRCLIPASVHGFFFLFFWKKTFFFKKKKKSRGHKQTAGSESVRAACLANRKGSVGLIWRKHRPWGFPFPLTFHLGLSSYTVWFHPFSQRFLSLPSSFFLHDLSNRYMLGVYFRSSLAFLVIIVISRHFFLLVLVFFF